MTLFVNEELTSILKTPLELDDDGLAGERSQKRLRMDGSGRLLVQKHGREFLVRTKTKIC